jgi:hypothetical protein
MEVNDPWLAELVKRADAGETIVDADGFLQTTETESSEEKIRTLAEIVCQAGDRGSAALFVLMARLESATHPKALANMVKHLAFTCCGELNVCGMVDSQVAVLEHELLSGETFVC